MFTRFSTAIERAVAWWQRECVYHPLPEPEWHPEDHPAVAEPTGAFWMTLLFLGSWLLFALFKWGPPS